jgi:hypothetical protein
VAEAIVEAEATQTATSPVSHAAATMPVAESRKFDARNPLRQARTTASPPSLLDFAICFFQRNSSLWGSPYDAKKDPVQWLRCYTLSIENAGGNNDTKFLYFPFCLD